MKNSIVENINFSQNAIEVVKAMVKNVVLTLKRRNELARQRHQLLNLEDTQLSDIGISRHQAVQEAARSVWDDPLAQASKQQYFAATQPLQSGFGVQKGF